MAGSLDLGALGFDLVLGKQKWSDTWKEADKDVETHHSKWKDFAANMGGKLAAGITAGLATVGTAIVAMTADGAKSAIQLDDSMAKFQSSTGKTAEETEQVKAIIKDLYKTNQDSYESLAETAEAMANNMGMSASEIGKYSQKFLDYAKVTKQGNADVVAAIDDIGDAWGLTNDEATGSMDKMLVLQQKYGMAVTDSQSALKDMAPSAKAAGMSINETMGYLAMFAQTGVDAGVASTAFTKALTQVKSPEELKQLIQDIKNCEDPMQRAQMASELFGAKAGPKMAQALAESSVSIDDFIKQMDGASGAVAKAGETYDKSLSVQMDLMKKQFSGMFEEIGEKVMPILQKFMDTLQAHMPQIEQLFTQVAGTVGTALGFFMDNIMPTLMNLLDAFFQLWQSIWPSIQSIFQAVWPLIQTALQLLTDTILPVLIQLIDAFIPPIKEIIEALMPSLQFIIQAVMDVINQLMPPIMEIVHMVLPMIMELLRPILALLQPLLNQLTPLLNAIIKPLTQILQMILMPILQALQPVIQALSPLFEVLGIVLKPIADLFNLIGSLISDLIDFIVNIFQGNWEAAWNAITKFFTDLWQGVCDFFQGIADFFVGIWDWLTGKSSETVDAMGAEVQESMDETATAVEARADTMKSNVSASYSSMADATASDMATMQKSNLKTWDSMKNDTTKTANEIAGTVNNAYSDMYSGSTQYTNDLSEKNNDTLQKVADDTKQIVGDLGEDTTGVFEHLLTLSQDIWRRVGDTIENTFTRVKAALADLTAVLRDIESRRYKVPNVQVPVIKKTGENVVNGATIPTFGVNWYDKGGIFYQPTVIGIAEKRTEVAAPLEELDKMIGNAVARNSKGGDVYITGNQFVIREEADIEKVSRRLNQLRQDENMALGVT